MSDGHYTYRVTWSPEDDEHVGLCLEFPSLSWLAATSEEAFAGICGLVQEVLADMKASEEPLPEPLAARAYSGRFVVRVTPETHRELVIRAAEEGVSLNRLVSTRLAKPAHGQLENAAGRQQTKSTKSRRIRRGSAASTETETRRL